MENFVRVKLLFFAKSRELAGLSECFIDLPKTILCTNLIKQLSETYNLRALDEKFLLALNNDYCDEPNAILNLKTGDEVAVIPPISGG